MNQNFDEKCKSRGLSITVQRQKVYEALMEDKSHPTVDSVYLAVRKAIPTISRATVYRTLETLADEGLIQRVLHPGSPLDTTATRRRTIIWFALFAGKQKTAWTPA